MINYFLMALLLCITTTIKSSESTQSAALSFDALSIHMHAAFGETFKQLPHLISRYTLSEQERSHLVANTCTSKLAEDISAGICNRSLQMFRELPDHFKKSNKALLLILDSALAQEIEHRLGKMNKHSA